MDLTRIFKEWFEITHKIDNDCDGITFSSVGDNIVVGMTWDDGKFIIAPSGVELCSKFYPTAEEAIQELNGTMITVNRQHKKTGTCCDDMEIAQNSIAMNINDFTFCPYCGIELA